METSFVADDMVNKLILLFVLEKMEIPLTENSILDICTSRNTWLGYMDCKEVLHQLVESKFIYTPSETKTESRYNLTYEGRNCLSMFFQRIPLSLRENITVFCKKNRTYFKRSQEYVAEYYKNSDGSYTVAFRINEPLVPDALLEIKIKTSTRASAIEACKKWRDSAPNTYEFLFETLLD